MVETLVLTDFCKEDLSLIWRDRTNNFYEEKENVYTYKLKLNLNPIPQPLKGTFYGFLPPNVCQNRLGMGGRLISFCQ